MLNATVSYQSRVPYEINKKGLGATSKGFEVDFVGHIGKKLYRMKFFTHGTIKEYVDRGFELLKPDQNWYGLVNI